MGEMGMIKLALPALAAALVLSTAADADYAHAPILRDLVASKLRQIAQDPSIVSAIAAQNLETASLTQADIDKLDKEWRAETKTADKPLIAKIEGRPVSAYLANTVQQGHGLITEIIVMDDKGLNVGVSSTTSDYWQGDEDKWAKTFEVGPDAIFVDDIERDESTQMLQAQVSFTIVDPATHAAIGAITFGINMDQVNG